MSRLFRFFSSSVRGRLTLLLSAVTAPAVLLVALLMIQAYRNERNAVVRHLTVTTRALASLVDQQLNESEALLKGLAISPDLAQGRLRAFDAHIRSALEGTGQWIVLIDLDGNEQVNTRLPPGSPLPHAALDPEALAAAKRGEAYVSNLGVGKVSQILRFYVSTPIFQDGELKYILHVAMPPAQFSKALDLERIAAENVVSIVDRTGTIVARSRSGNAFIGRKATPDILTKINAAAQGVTNSVTLEGISVLAAFNRCPMHEWTAIIGTPHSALYASARRLLWVGLAFSCLLIGSAVLIARWIGRSVVDSVDSLVSDVEAIGRGTLPPERGVGLAETDFVTRAMRDTAQRLTEKERDNAKLYAALQVELQQQKHAEELSRRLAAIVESSHDAIVGKTLGGIVTSWNKGAERIFGYSAAEMIGQSIRTIIPPESAAEEDLIIERIRRGEQIEHYETTRRRKNGSRVAVSLTVSPIRDAEGRILGASKIARDITARQAFEAQQQALFELVATVNRAAALPEIYNAALDAIDHAQHSDRAAILLYDDDRTMRFKASRGLSEEYQRAVEGHSPWAPDEPAAESVCLPDVASSALEPALRQTLLREGIGALVFIPIRYERRLLGKFVIYYNHPRGFTREELRPAETIASQVAFALERHKSAAALEKLVDERTASLRAAIAQMQEFSYSVSHDLRSPVRAMQGYAAIILEDHGAELGENGRELLARIQRNGLRMDRLIQDLLIYSRLTQREIALERTSIEKLLHEVISHYTELQPANVDIEIVGQLHEVMAHEPTLFQVVSNLLTNAVKFVAPAVRPRVRIWSELRGTNVRVWFEDNGIGITPQHQARLFGLFERIHPDRQYEGTGIGLAIVRKAVERMKGTVGLESDGKTGSKFWFEVPGAF